MPIRRLAGHPFNQPREFLSFTFPFYSLKSIWMFWILYFKPEWGNKVLLYNNNKPTMGLLLDWVASVITNPPLNTDKTPKQKFDFKIVLTMKLTSDENIILNSASKQSLFRPWRVSKIPREKHGFIGVSMEFSQDNILNTAKIFWRNKTCT